MAQLFTNNAAGLLNASITSTDLSLTLQSGQGAKFPSVGGSDFFLVTLFSVVSNVEVNHEIIKVTARVGDTFTIVRGQEGTNPGNWSVGTNVQLRITAAALSSFITEIGALTTDYNLHEANVSNPHSVTKSQVGLSTVTNDAQLKIAANLSDLASVSTARTNLGLGTAATQASTAFEPANANIQSHITNTSNPHTVTKSQVGLGNVTNDAQLKIASNLSDLANASTARTNLGLGTLAVSSSVEGSIITPFNERDRIINGDFSVNQKAYVSGAAVGADLHGHDCWKMAASGDSYTFSTANNVTVITIPAGKVLRQVIEGINIETRPYILSWLGTSQGKINAGSYGVSPVVATITGGTSVTIEFGPGTLSDVSFTPGAVVTPTSRRIYQLQEMFCKRYFEKSYEPSVAPGTASGLGMYSQIALNGYDFYTSYLLQYFNVPKAGTVTMAYYNPDGVNHGRFYNYTSSAPDNTVTIRYLTSKGFSVGGGGTMTANQLYGTHWTASARL